MTTSVDHNLIRTTERTVDPSAPPRPPTVFGRQSEWSVVLRGYALAWEAVHSSVDGAPAEATIRKLLTGTGPARREILRMAHDYLAFTDFGVPNAAQVDALLNVENALGRLGHHERRSRASRRLGRVRQWAAALASPFRPTGHRRRRHRTA
ncbi:hypothetical protein GCM10009547_00780 [Sporichthya brevicatena]|uniref:Uncharacterized protein n=1 Tax=Sporichthya brevicatena TaxID=171442 RepID=A0ABN1G311_9ACTN